MASICTAALLYVATASLCRHMVVSTSCMHACKGEHCLPVGICQRSYMHQCPCINQCIIMDNMACVHSCMLHTMTYHAYMSSVLKPFPEADAMPALSKTHHVNIMASSAWALNCMFLVSLTCHHQDRFSPVCSELQAVPIKNAIYVNEMCSSLACGFADSNAD